MRIKTIGVLALSVSLAFCASAQQKLRRAQEKDPKYQYNVGLVYLNQSNVDPKNIDVAVSYFEKSLALDAKYYLAWNAIGLAQSLRGNIEEAARSYRKCLEINPGFAEAHNNLGTIYQESGKLDLAENEFKSALLDPTYRSRELPFYNLARLDLVQDRLEEAYENVQRAIQSQPRMAMAHHLRGLILERQEKLTEAIGSYETAVKIVPDDVTFSFDLGAAYFKAEEYAKAKEVFLRISSRVTDPETRDKITQFLRAIGDKG